MRAFEQFGAACRVGGESVDAARAEQRVGAFEQVEVAEQRVRQQRQEGVEFELAGLRGERHRLVLRHDLQRGLADGLADHRVDLAGHGAGADLHGRQAQFAEPRARAGGEQAQVGGNLEQVDRVRLEDAGHLDEGVGVLRGVDQVLGAREVHPRRFAQRVDDAEDVGARRGQPGADRRAAEVDHAQPLLALEHAPAVAAAGFGPGRAFGAERHRTGVLQLRAADLDDVREVALARLERRLQPGDGLFQPAQAVDRGDLERGREDVVGRLVQIHVIQRMHAPVLAAPAAEPFLGAVGEHFVHVHVERGTGAALQRVDHDGFGQPGFAVRQFAAGGGDGLADLRVEMAERRVGPRAGQLHQRHAAHQRRRARPAGQREVGERPRGVDAVQGVGRDGEVPKGIGFDAGRHGRPRQPSAVPAAAVIPTHAGIQVSGALSGPRLAPG